MTITVRGEFQNGKLEGNGATEYSSGAKFEGQWSQNKQHGQGKLTGPSNEFEGQFVSGKRWNGIGTHKAEGAVIAGYRIQNGEQTVLCRVDKKDVGCSATERGLLLKGVAPGSGTETSQLAAITAPYARPTMAKPPLVSADQVPSEKSGEFIVFNLVAQNVGKAPFKIQSFAKTNGQRAEVSGVKIYKMWFTATVDHPAGVNPECVNSNKAPIDCLAYASRASQLIRAPGQSATYEGVLQFEQTERGWLGQDGRLY